MRPFDPLISNPDLATIASNYWPRYRELDTYPVSAVRYRTEEQVTVLVHEQRPRGEAKGELVLVHGLEGSSEAGYLRSMAYSALEAGYAVHRLNIRGCGGTEGWCRTLYHAGLTSDLRFLIESLSARNGGPIYLAGYSLGGNIVLKLAGEWGAASPLRGVCSVSTPIDLSACARALNMPRNFVYQNRFVKRMRNRLEERRRLQPDVFGPIFERTRVEDIRTVYDFDDRITAPSFGFGSAGNYYATQSSKNFLARIATPTLLIAAQDDPLVPFSVYAHPAIEANRNLRLLAPEHGGHVSFLARTKPRFWVDSTLLEWIEFQGNKTGVPLVF